MSQVKSCDLKPFNERVRAIEWYRMVFGRECERCFFARKSCEIVCLESSRSALESTCRDGEQRKVFLIFL